MLKTYGFLSKKYDLWASFFQFIISRNLFYWIAPQLIFTSSQKKISTKNFENSKSWRYFLKNFRKKIENFEKFWDFWNFRNFSKIFDFFYRKSYTKFSKILKIFKNVKNLKNFENFSESTSNFSHFQNFSSRFFLRWSKNSLRSDSIK